MHSAVLLLGSNGVDSLGGQLGLISACHDLISELTVACLRLPIHWNHILLKRGSVLDRGDLLQILVSTTATSVVQPVDNEERLNLFAQVLGVCAIFDGPIESTYNAP